MMMVMALSTCMPWLDVAMLRLYPYVEMVGNGVDDNVMGTSMMLNTLLVELFAYDSIESGWIEQTYLIVKAHWR